MKKILGMLVIVLFATMMMSVANATNTITVSSNASTWYTVVNQNFSINITASITVPNTSTNVTLLNFTAPANVLIWYGGANTVNDSINNATMTCSNGGDGAWVNCTHPGIQNISASPANIIVNFNISASAEANYTLTIYSTDNNSGTSSATLDLGFDVSPPTTAATAPTGWQNTTFTVTLTPTDTVSGVAYTNYSLDGGANTTGTSVSISTNGNHSIDYYSVDNAGHIETTNRVYAALDTSNPIVNLGTPTNDSWTNSRTVTFTFTPIEMVSNLRNCSLYTSDGGWGVKNSTTSPTNATSNSLTYTFSADGIYLWNVECYDLANNSAFNSSNYTIKIDTVAPNITLVSPANASNSSSTIVTLNYTPTDSFGLMNCSLWITDSTGGNFAFNQSNSSAITNGSSSNYFIFTGVNNGNYTWNVKCYDYAGNSNFSVMGNGDAYGNYTFNIRDLVAPTFNLSINGSNGVNITRGGAVNVSLSIADASNITSVNVSVIPYFGQQPSGLIYQCYLNSTPSSPTSLTAECPTFGGTNTTYGGRYIISIAVADSAGNINNTYANQSDSSHWGTYYFKVWNGQPLPSYANATAANVSSVIKFAQKRSNYTLEIPYYQGDNNTLYSGMVNPMYLDNVSFPVSNTMEDLMYNYTFNITFSSDLVQGNPSINLTARESAPANISVMTVYTPAGVKNITLAMPDFTNRIFTIYYYNGSEYVSYQSNGALTSSHPVNGTWTMENGIIQLHFKNDTFNGTTSTFTLLLSTIPPINITNQAIVGFDRNHPPELNSTSAAGLTTSYYANLTANNNYYSAENMTVDIIFPKNITIGSTTQEVLIGNITINISTNGGTNWTTVAYSNGTYNQGWVIPFTASFVMNDSIPGSPTRGQLMNITLSGYKLRLNLSSSEVSWKLGDNLLINASATLNFSILNYSREGSGAAGTSVSYNATVISGVKSGVKIPTSYLPGFSSSVTGLTVKLNGKTLTKDVDFSIGSIDITGESLLAGSNVISISYSVPSSSTTSPGFSGPGVSTPEEVSQMFVFTALEAGSTVTMQLSKEEMHVQEITLTVKNPANNVKITIQKESEKPAEVTKDITGKNIYEYFKISKQNLKNADIESAVLKFKVSRQWFSDNNLDPETAGLDRFNEETQEWEHYDATMLDSDDDYYYFEAEVPGFSVFAITAVAPAAQPTTPPEQPQQPATPPAQQPQQPGEKVAPAQPISMNTAIGLIALIVFVFAVALFLKRRR